MQNRGSTPISTNMVGVHPRNIDTKSSNGICDYVYIRTKFMSVA